MENHDGHGTPEDTTSTKGRVISVDETATSKVISGAMHDDTLTISTDGKTSNQWHVYASGGHDVINLDVSSDPSVAGVKHGHHVFVGDGSDTIRFIGLEEMSGTIVGRIDDFNRSTDRIMIGDQILDLANPSAINGYDVYFTRIPNYSSPEMRDQQIWLVIEGENGRALYAMEGARKNAAGEDEVHFLRSGTAIPTDLPRVAWDVSTDYILARHEIASGAFIETGRGSNADDRTTLTGHHAVWMANGGDDLVRGTSGGDLIDAGRGDDTVHGGDGGDTVLGYFGDDLIFGENGDDLLEGRKGHDTIHGGNGNDTIYGGIDNDSLEGEDGNDLIYAGSGDDFASGGSGDDTIVGDHGNDTLLGGAGRDLIGGGAGDGLIDGGAGADVITAGAGRDTIIAGAGDAIRLGHGEDVIRVGGVTKGGPAALMDYSPDDTIRFAPGENGPIDVRYGFDMSGNLVFANANMDPLLVVRANEVSSFDLGSVVGAASLSVSGSGFRGDLYASVLEAAGTDDPDAITVMDPSLPADKPVPDPDPKPEDDDEEESASGGGGSCFVATAAYGSQSHPDVVAMRRYRDEVLVGSVAGRWFVRLYWSCGPCLAKKIRPGSLPARLARGMISRLARGRQNPRA